MSQEEDQKYTISIPKSVSEHLSLVKKHLNLKTIAGTFALGIELLHWVVQSEKEGFEIKAEKTDGNIVTIQKLPLITK
jgi:hypothetical protein